MTPSSNVWNKTFCCFQCRTTKQVPQKYTYVVYTSLPLITFELAYCMVLIFCKLSVIIIVVVQRAVGESYIPHNPLREIQIY